MCKLDYRTKYFHFVVMNQKKEIIFFKNLYSNQKKVCNKREIFLAHFLIMNAKSNKFRDFVNKTKIVCLWSCCCGYQTFSLRVPVISKSNV